MASRGEMIKRARRRVDARRDARRADIRDQARATYGRDLGKRKFAPTEPNVGSGGDRLLEIIRGAGGDLKRTGENIADKTGEGIMGVYDAGAKFVKSLMSNIDRSAQNREILGDAYTDDLRKSMMTDDDLDFYNKYVGLADLASDNQERERLMGIANTAMQNAQITNRINYALGQPKLGFETTAPAGVANIDYSTLADRMVYGTDASTGLLGTAIGKEFVADAYKAQEDEPGDTLISQYMKNYPTTFVGGNKMLEDLKTKVAQQDGIVRGLQESDVAEFDPYLNPSFPFYGGNRQKYMNYLFQSGAYD
jgi:hypothetical protein